jgi:hypothetical protein
VPIASSESEQLPPECMKQPFSRRGGRPPFHILLVPRYTRLDMEAADKSFILVRCHLHPVLPLPEHPSSQNIQDTRVHPIKLHLCTSVCVTPTLPNPQKQLISRDRDFMHPFTISQGILYAVEATCRKRAENPEIFIVIACHQRGELKPA